MCKLKDGTCINPSNRHPDEQCLICNSDGKWMKQPRSVMIDAFGPASLNVLPSNIPELEYISSENGELLLSYH